MARKSPTPLPATLPQDRRQRSLRSFFACYAEHRPFSTALMHLTYSRPSLSDIEQFAAQWKLDRLPEGPGVLLQWLESRHLSGDVSIGRFGSFVMVMDTIPGDPADETVHLATDEDPDDDRWYIWESRAEARARLITRLDSELDRIEADRRSLHYDFPDDEHRLQQHLLWTFQRYVLEYPPAKIAEKAGGKDTDHIRKTTAGLRKELGFCG